MPVVNRQMGLQLLLLTSSILLAHPTTSSSSCPEADITAVLSILRTSINASQPLQEPAETTLKRCPTLSNIFDTLNQVNTGVLQIEQAGLCRSDVNKLRKAFNRKVDNLLGTDRVETLRTQVDTLRTQMLDTTTDLYENSVGSMIKLLAINRTFHVRSFSKRELMSPLVDLNPDYKLYLNALQYLNRTNDVAVVGTVFDGILSRLNKLYGEIERRLDTGRNDLVNLLCWTVNNSLLDEKYSDKKDDILKIARQFYPKDGNTKEYRTDIDQRKKCSERFPHTVIRGMALGLHDVE